MVDRTIRENCQQLICFKCGDINGEHLYRTWPHRQLYNCNALRVVNELTAKPGEELGAEFLKADLCGPLELWWLPFRTGRPRMVKRYPEPPRGSL